jgi:hypothetical protein
MHQLWESRTDGKYFKLCKILREFPIKLRKYYRMNLKIFYYILDDLQGYSSFTKCTEAEEKRIFALQYPLNIVVRININCIYTMVNAIKIQCNLKQITQEKVRFTLNFSKL